MYNFWNKTDYRFFARGLIIVKQTKKGVYKMVIKLENLTKLEQGKFKILLNKTYDINNKIMSLNDFLQSGEFISKEFAEVEHKSGPKNEYLFKCKSGGYLQVPKIVYKAIEFNTVNIGGLHITNANERGICQLAVDDLNRMIKDARETDQLQDLRESLYTTNLQELKKQGVYIIYGICWRDLPLTIADFCFLVRQAFLNDYEFKVCI